MILSSILNESFSTASCIGRTSPVLLSTNLVEISSLAARGAKLLNNLFVTSCIAWSSTIDLNLLPSLVAASTDFCIKFLAPVKLPFIAGLITFLPATLIAVPATGVIRPSNNPCLAIAVKSYSPSLRLPRDISTSWEYFCWVAPPIPATAPSAPSPFEIFQPAWAKVFLPIWDLRVAMTPCLSASLPAWIATPPVPPVTIPASIDIKLVGSDIAARP